MSKVKIGEEGTQQGHYVCGLVEDVNDCCKSHDLHVEDDGQIKCGVC
jgi:hypothetical protein